MFHRTFRAVNLYLLILDFNMEKAIEIFFQQSALVIFMGILIVFMYRYFSRKIDKLEIENMRLNQYILDREKEISDEKSEELKATVPVLSKVVSVLDEHNKLTEYEQRKKYKA